MKKRVKLTNNADVDDAEEEQDGVWLSEAEIGEFNRNARLWLERPDEMTDFIKTQSLVVLQTQLRLSLKPPLCPKGPEISAAAGREFLKIAGPMMAAIARHQLNSAEGVILLPATVDNSPHPGVNSPSGVGEDGEGEAVEDRPREHPPSRASRSPRRAPPTPTTHRGKTAPAAAGTRKTSKNQRRR